MIIALVGMCGSGKSEAANYFQKRGMAGVYFGEVTMERLREAGLPPEPDNERRVREDIRREYGMGGYATLSIEKISALLEKADQGGQPIYIDGLYSTEEYEILEERFPQKIVLLEIYTDKDIRYRRLGRRSHRPLSPDQCRERDWAEVKKLNKGGPIALSDYKISNNEEMADFHQGLETVLKKINK